MRRDYPTPFTSISLPLPLASHAVRSPKNACVGGCSPRIEYFINSSLFTIVTRALIPWVPKAFHAQFPISVKSFLKICHPALFSFRLFAFDQLFVKKPADLRLCDQSPTTKVNNTLSFHPLTNRGGLFPV